MRDSGNDGAKIITTTAGAFTEGLNVYDCMEFIYESGAEWDRYLSRKDAEEYIRRRAFKGGDAAGLMDDWNRISCLLIYSVNSETYIGDFTPDDFVYCVSWCIRNIAEFLPTPNFVKDFLACCDGLMEFLKAKKSINRADVASKAANLLLSEDGKLLNMDEEGNLSPLYLKKRNNIVPDFPYSIFLNQPEAMDMCFSEIKKYMMRSEFEKDRIYAGSLFFGGMGDADEIDNLPSSLYHTFMEYFVFDYTMYRKDKKFIEHFVEYYCELHKPHSVEEKQVLFLLKELRGLKLRFFTVESIGERPGSYLCKDFFTGGYLQVGLPLDSVDEAEDFLFTGHVMPDGNLVSDYTKGLHLHKRLHKSVRSTVGAAKEWYAIQCPAASDWNVFLSDNASLVMNFVALSSTLNVGIAFPYRSGIKDYKVPEKTVEDAVSRDLKVIAEMLDLPVREERLMLNLWTDFVLATGTECEGDEGFLWALAVVFLYLDISGTSMLSLDEYSKQADISEELIVVKIKEISDVLSIEECDPRYINEEGLLKMLTD